MILAIDFDDTIHDRSQLQPGHKMGVPMEGSLETINELVAQGHQLYVLTASTRARMKSVRDWLAYFNFPPLHVTDTKHKADAYIDDKGIRFTNWPDILEQLNENTQ